MVIHETPGEQLYVNFLEYSPEYLQEDVTVLVAFKYDLLARTSRENMVDVSFARTTPRTFFHGNLLVNWSRV